MMLECRQGGVHGTANAALAFRLAPGGQLALGGLVGQQVVERAVQQAAPVAGRQSTGKPGDRTHAQPAAHQRRQWFSELPLNRVGAAPHTLIRRHSRRVVALKRLHGVVSNQPCRVPAWIREFISRRRVTVTQQRALRHLSVVANPCPAIDTMTTRSGDPPEHLSRERQRIRRRCIRHVAIPL